MKQVIILGSGAAPGVPSLCCGWGDCNPENPKNRRLRTSVYLDFNGVKLLIDTSPDIRQQFLTHNIRELSAVLYTHSHADHLHGIDYLREINRITHASLNFYGSRETVDDIKQRFRYLITSPKKLHDVLSTPSLVANSVRHNEPFYIKDVKITPIKLIGHNIPTTGWIFNDGEYVHIADFRTLDDEAWKMIRRRPKLLVIPLTTPFGQKFHAGFDDVMACIEKINPERAVINHMATECDYDTINNATPDNVEPAFDNMIINL